MRALRDAAVRGALAGAVALALACARQAPEAAAGGRKARVSEVVVGATMPLTGAESKAGAMMREGYELAFAEQMAKGGLLIAGQRAPVKLVLLDDRSDPKAAAELASQLVENEKVDLLLGSYSTPLTEAQSTVAEKLKIPYVSPGAAATALFKRGYRYLFGLLAPVDRMGGTLMRWIEDEQRAGHLPGRLRIAIAWEKTAHGADYRAGILEHTAKAEAREAFEVVFDDSFPLKTKDFDPLLERIQSANADVLLVDAHLEDYLAMQKQYAARGLCHQVLSYGARGPEKEARAALGDASHYILSAVWWNQDMTTNQTAKAFSESFKASYGRSPSWYQAMAYEAARALFAAVEQANSIDREAVRDALAHLSMPSVLPGGHLSFPEQYGHQAQYPFLVQQNLPDGSAPIIYPQIAQRAAGVAANPRCARPMAGTAKPR